MTSEDSQCELILRRLRATPGEWISMPELCQISGSYNIHTRIDQLRHGRGVAIENDIRRKPLDRRQYSYYRVPPVEKSGGKPDTIPERQASLPL